MQTKFLSFEVARIGMIVWDTDYDVEEQEMTITDLNEDEESIELTRFSSDGRAISSRWYRSDTDTFEYDSDFDYRRCVKYEASRVVKSLD